MNKSQLTAHVAAKASVTGATTDILVDAVFSAVADALAHDETVAIAGLVRRPKPRRAPRPKPSDRRASRHRGLEGAIVHAGEGAPRRGQRIAPRKRVPGRLSQ